VEIVLMLVLVTSFQFSILAVIFNIPVCGESLNSDG